MYFSEGKNEKCVLERKILRLQITSLSFCLLGDCDFEQKVEIYFKFGFFSFCLRIGSESFDGYRDLGEFVWEKLIEREGRANLEDPGRI